MQVVRRRLTALLGAAVLVVNGIGAGAALANPKKPTAYLIVSSNGSASAIVDITRTIENGTPFDTFAASFRGSYAGYLISTVHGKPLLGRARVRDAAVPAGESIPLWWAFKPLPPGRYRITVIGAGPVSVQIPIAAHHDRRVNLTGHIRAFAGVARPETPDVDPVGTPVANFGLPVPAGHYQIASLQRYGQGRFTQANVGDECFTATQSCAMEGSFADSGFFTFGNTGDGAFSSGSSTSPMDIRPGVNAMFDGINAGIASKQSGVVILIGAADNG